MLIKHLLLCSAFLSVASVVYGQVKNPPTTPPPPVTPKTPTPPTKSPPSASKTTPPPTVATPIPSPIYRMDDVSRALTINDRQYQQLNTMTQQLQERYQTQYDRISRMPERERQDRLMQLNREYTNAWLDRAKNHLDDRQLARYQQLQLQYGGYSTFNDPGIQKQLNLTDAQLRTLGESLTWSNQRTQEINAKAQTDPVLARQWYIDYAKEYQDRLIRILTKDQQRQWTDLTGAAFPFPPPFGAPSADTTTPKR